LLCLEGQCRGGCCSSLWHLPAVFPVVSSSPIFNYYRRLCACSDCGVVRFSREVPLLLAALQPCWELCAVLRISVTQGHEPHRPSLIIEILIFAQHRPYKTHETLLALNNYCSVEHDADLEAPRGHDMFTICSFISPDLDGNQGTRENKNFRLGTYGTFQSMVMFHRLHP
jgi:hypothetical protein